MVDNLDALQFVTLPYFKIVWIVGWRNLNGAGAVGRVDVLVGNNRDFTVSQRQHDARANELFVTFVVRVDSDSNVAKERLWAGGSDDDLADLVERWVGDFPELALLVFVLYLDIGKAGLVNGTVVNDPFAAVDKIFVPKFFEGAVNGVYHLFVQRED